MAIDRAQLPALVREDLDAFVEALRARFGQRLLSVRLFGSFARGQAHEDSDVDCLVLLDRVTPEDDRAVTDLAGNLDLADRRRHDISLNHERARVRAVKRRERRTPLEIERDGIVLLTNENKRMHSAAELAHADESLRAARLLSDAVSWPTP